MRLIVRTAGAIMILGLASGGALADSGTSSLPQTGAAVRKIQLKHADAQEIASVFTDDSGSRDAPLVARAAPADAHVRLLAPPGRSPEALPEPQTYAQFFPAQQRRNTGASPLLPEGIVGPPIAYPRDNSLIVKGTLDALDEFEELLRAFDVPTKQVRVRATVIDTLDRTADDYGIAWIAQGAAEVVSATGGTPGPGPTLRFARGNFTAVLGAAETRERSRVVSEPFVVTANLHPVDLSVATMYPYFSPIVEYTPWGTRIVGYEAQTVAVGVDLFVLPRINADDTVHLSIAPTFSEIVGGRSAPDGQVLPVIAANRFATEITVRDGETVCVAGLPRDRRSETSVGVPYLPPLGQHRERETGEMLIFVTPQIMRGAAATE